MLINIIMSDNEAQTIEVIEMLENDFEEQQQSDLRSSNQSDELGKEFEFDDDRTAEETKMGDETKNMTIRDFKILQSIGKGAYGEVFVAEKDGK